VDDGPFAVDDEFSAAVPLPPGPAPEVELASPSPPEALDLIEPAVERAEPPPVEVAPSEPLGFGEVSFEDGVPAPVDDPFNVPAPDDPFGAASPAPEPSASASPGSGLGPPPVEVNDSELLIDDAASQSAPSPSSVVPRAPRPSGPAAPRVEQLAPLVPEGSVSEDLPIPAPPAPAPRRRKGALAVIAAVLLVAGGGAAGGLTRHGLFFNRLLLPASFAPSADPSKKPGASAQSAEEAWRSFGQDRLEAVQSALGAATQLLTRDARDKSAAALYCQAAAWLEQHGSSGPALAQAWKVIEGLNARAEDAPATRAAHVQLGLAAGAAGAKTAQAAKLELANQDKPFTDEEALFALGDVAFANKELPKALQLYRKVEAAHPSARSSHKLGLVSQAQGDLASARRAFEQALARDASHASSAVELAASLDGVQDGSKIEALLRDAIGGAGPAQLAPRERARARALLGARIVRVRTADGASPPEGQQLLQGALEDDPGCVPARIELARSLMRAHGYDEAAALLAAAPGESARDVQVLALRARALAGAGKVLDAFTLLDAQLGRISGNPPLLFAKGVVLESNGKQAEAVKAYQDAAERDPDLWEARVALARAAQHGGDLARAEKELLAAAERAPGEAEPQARLGDLWAAHGNWSKAEEAYKKALAVDPAHAGALFGAGRVLQARGDKAGARASIQRAVTLDPRLAEAQLALGDILATEKELPKAHQAYQAAVSGDPRSALAHARLGQIELQEGQTEAALAQLQQSANLDLSLAEAHHWLGRALIAKGDRSAGLEQLVRAVELAPTNATFHLQLGIAREAANALTDAIDAYQRAVEKDPKLIEGWERLGMLHAAQERCQEALPFFQKAIGLAPDQQRLRVELGDCRAKLGQYAEALKLYRQALKADPALAGVDYRMARALHESAGLAQALSLYEKAARDEKQNPMPHYYLGYAYKERGQRARAVHEFKAYLAARPDAEDRKDIEQEIEDLGGKP
jgi:tetratricopeptide (TPR) repeat protein